MADMRKLVLALDEDIQQHPLVISALADAEHWAKIDGFHGVPEYDATRIAIESVQMQQNPMPWVFA